MLEKLLDRFREKGPARPRSKIEMEKRRRAAIVLVIVAAVVSAIGIVGWGYYSTSVRPWNQRVLKVNGTVLDMRHFVKMLRLYGATSADSADSVLSTMKENEISRQRLKEDFGVVISKEAVEAKLREELVSYGFISENATDSEFKEGQKNLKKALKRFDLSVEDYKELLIEPSLVSEELKRLVGEREYPSTDNFEHAQVQALLVSGADDAANLRARWEAGESFDTLAKEKSVSSSLRDYATDNATKAEWVAKGIKSAAFDGFAFGASFDMLSDPIQDTDSTTSYWLIRVVARESRTLSDSDRETLASEAYSKWLEEATDPEKNEIVEYLTDAKRDWALDQVKTNVG
ncbi:MAG: hypothetical protein QUS33_13490 [Dehalococcoidia bacterium]|nr:hypothetical protein [Dehalococcoidia bacterium]